LVVRKQADVDHVRVRKDRVRPFPDLPPLLGRRVAVVDRGSQSWHTERVQRPELVLCERFGRVQVEHAALRGAGERVEYGQVEGERLARRRPGGHDEVLAASGGLPGGELVEVEGLDSDRVADSWVEVGWDRARAGVARRLLGAVRELLALEKRVG